MSDENNLQVQNEQKYKLFNVPHYFFLLLIAFNFVT
jgi:hypothetical protein